jgi:hypothetical protein
MLMAGRENSAAYHRVQDLWDLRVCYYASTMPTTSGALALMTQTSHVSGSLFGSNRELSVVIRVAQNQACFSLTMQHIVALRSNKDFWPGICP